MKLCPNCGRPVYGFWKYGQYVACQKSCFRVMIANGRIPRLFPERGYPELGISAPNKTDAEHRDKNIYTV